MTTVLQVKIKQDHFDTFERKCKETYRIKHTDMIREMIEAFNEGRLNIIPSKTQTKLFKEIYKND